MNQSRRGVTRVAWASVRECPPRTVAVILASVKLTVRSSSDEISDVWVFLTEAEAEEVASALRSRIKGEEGFRGPGYHLHLEEANGSELTIGVLDEPE